MLSLDTEVTSIEALDRVKARFAALRARLAIVALAMIGVGAFDATTDQLNNSIALMSALLTALIPLIVILAVFSLIFGILLGKNSVFTKFEHGGHE